MRILWLFLLLVTVVQAEFFPEDSTVLLLHKNTFQKRLLANSTAAIVFFFAPYCEHSKKFAPIYSNVAQSFQGVILFAAVDCSESINQALCRQFEIKNFPTLKLFPPETDPPENQAAIAFDGPRTAQALAEKIKELVNDNFVQKLAEGEEPRLGKTDVLLFTKKDKPTLLYKSLSWRYHHLAVFHEIKTTNQALLDQFKVTDFPALIVIKDGEQTRYSGNLSAPALIDFFDGLFDIQHEMEVDLYLRFLKPSDFKQIDEDEEIWLVAFFADPQGDGCVHNLELLQKSIVKVVEYSRVGVYNISSSEGASIDLTEFALKQSKLESHPCSFKIVRFPFGSDKSEQDLYEIYSQEVDPSLLQEFVFEAITAQPIRLTKDTTMQGFMSNAYQTPKVILFSSHEACPKLFAALAMSLRHWNVDFGFVPLSERRLQNEFQVNKIPTLIFIFVDPTAEENKQVYSPKYQGPLQFGPMKGWLEAVMFTLKIKKEDYKDPFFKAEAADHVQQIKNEEDLKKTCNESIPLCGFVALDSRNEKFEMQLDWLGNFIVQKSNAPISFAWIDVHQGEVFFRDFGVGIGDAPTIIVFSPKRRRYATLKRQLDSQQAEDFFYKVINGEQPTFPIESLPKWTIQETENSFQEEEENLEEIMSISLETEKQNFKKDEL